MEIVGYAHIDRNATTGSGSEELDTFIGKTCRVYEFGSDGSVLVVNSKGTSLASFDKKDVYRKFECTLFGEVICPPDLAFFEQMRYATKCATRKGGYCQLLAKIIVENSLRKGVFSDSFIWQKQ